MNWVWKPGDLCSFLPSRRLALSKKDANRVWTIREVGPQESALHDGPAGIADCPRAGGKEPGRHTLLTVPTSFLLRPRQEASEASLWKAEVYRLQTRVAALEALLRNSTPKPPEELELEALIVEWQSRSGKSVESGAC